MANPIFEFDPTSENASNVPLLLSTANGYGVTEFNPDAANQSVGWAESVDTEGALPAWRKDENRTVSLTVECTSAAALRSLQAKVAKIGREQGTLKYTLPGGEVIVFELLSRQTYRPVFDQAYYVNNGAFCSVQIGFTAKPYGLGPEIQVGSSDNVETTLPALVFTASNIPGDVPALGRLVVDNDAAKRQATFRWGMESRNYSSGPYSALFFQAENCLLNGGTVVTGPTGASGGATNNTVRYGGNVGDIPYYESGHAEPMTLGPTAAQTHVGDFRVFARVQVEMGVYPLVMRASWAPTVTSDFYAQSYTPWRKLETSQGSNVPNGIQWLLVDLGIISIPKAKTGNQGWIGHINVASTDISGSNTERVWIDYVMFVPIAEGSGEAVRAPSSTSPALPSNGTAHIRHDGAFVDNGSNYLTRLPGYTGDYLRVPPSGAENRPVRFIVKMTSNGDSFPGATGTKYANWDGEIDDLSAKLYVRPRYLVVPAP